MDLLAAAGGAAGVVAQVFQAEENTGLTINLFWVIVAAVNFIVFLLAIWIIFFKPVSGMLEERRSRIEQGLKDADAARIDREQAAQERLAALAQARTEAEDILTRAQRVADESRERDLAETRAQIEQMRERAAADITNEKERAIAEVRGQVAELALAAAARVVGETMNDARERRLVDEFLNQMSTSSPSTAAGNAGGSSAAASATDDSGQGRVN
jgi:F-type H+-transporting ATPase subunit b